MKRWTTAGGVECEVDEKDEDTSGCVVARQQRQVLHCLVNGILRRVNSNSDRAAHNVRLKLAQLRLPRDLQGLLLFQKVIFPRLRDCENVSRHLLDDRRGCSLAIAPVRMFK